MDYKELKKKFEGRTVNALVKEVSKFNKDAIENGKEVMYRLWYLEKSGRYHEYEGYKQIEFKEFVWEICHIPYNRYRGLLHAYNWFPKEAERFGPHVIQKIKSKIGKEKLPRVLKEITRECDSLHDKGKQREKIHQIIAKYTPPAREVDGSDTKMYWRNKAQSLDVENKELIRRIKELEARIERNKPFVEAALAVQSSMKDMPRLSA